ncbi:MAG: SpoIIE family protein phosphatase, partial [Erysipelothrix sp.]|nr:SpoIIE family protein phosphatase [Erysipelothrix sp.]
MRVAVDAFYQSLNKHSEELCGDRVAIVHTPHSFVCVLADGLGSGVKANILATLTSTILAEMLKNGVELHEAVYTLTSTLPTCKERQVAYSTFSTLQVFNNGEAVLIGIHPLRFS